MEYIYSNLGFIEGGSTVRVDLDTQANVLLLDPTNYYKYQSGLDFRYRGGLATWTPFRIPVPYSGSWYVVIDLANVGGAGSVSYSIHVEAPDVFDDDSGFGITEAQRKQILREIQDKEAALEAFRESHPRSWLRIREMENQIQGLKNYLKNSHY